jgi:hypothetical protein
MGSLCSSGTSSTPSSVSVTNIPDYAKPYVLGNGTTTGLLPQAQSLSQNAYQPYTGQLTAGLNPLQTQAMQSVQGMGISPQTMQATGMAGLAGLNAGNIGNTYNPGNIGYNQTGINSYTGDNVNQFMSPYIDDVVNRQQNDAIRGYAQSLPGMGAVASNSGNLGSSRQSLAQSEAQRNLGSQMQGIAATGYQNAFQNAQNQFNQQNQLGLQSQTANQNAALQAQQQGLQSSQFGANLGLQGIQQQLAASGQLGQLGQNAFGQQKDITTAQMNAGNIGQNTENAALQAQYQQFLNQRQWPYQQLQFMSDIIHGTAANAAGNTSNYQQAPNTLGQLQGLATSASGLAGLFGAGG